MDDKDMVKSAYALQLKTGAIPEDFEFLEGMVKKKLIERKEKGFFLTREGRSKIKVVLTGGVFDVIHPGHIFMLNKCKGMGDVLAVVVACDETVKKTKGREPLQEERYRALVVESLKPVDVALVGEAGNREKIIERVGPDLIIYGYDQEPFYKFPKWLKFEEHLNKEVFKTSKILENAK